jgi:phosphatidate cytidylyltransferase
VDLFGSAITDNTEIVLAGIFGILLFSTIAVVLLKKFEKKGNYDNIALRIKSWWIVIILLTAINYAQPNIIIWFWAIVSFLALKEYFTMIPTRRADRRVLFWAYLTIPVQYYLISINWFGMFLIFIPVYAFLFLPTRMLIIGETQGFLTAIGTIHWGTMMMVFGLSHIAYMYVISADVNPLGGAAGLPIFLLFTAQFNDAAQYFFGKLLGRHKIIPKVSPNKTVEGFLGGVVTTILLSALLGPYITPMDLTTSLWVGAILSVAGFFGDITISAIKRDIQIKDTGTLLPGHGGLLDRVDSLTFTAPIFLHVIRYFYGI